MSRAQNIFQPVGDRFNSSFAHHSGGPFQTMSRSLQLLKEAHVVRLFFERQETFGQSIDMFLAFANENFSKLTIHSSPERKPLYSCGAFSLSKIPWLARSRLDAVFEIAGCRIQTFNGHLGLADPVQGFFRSLAQIAHGLHDLRDRRVLLLDIENDLLCVLG